MELPGIRGKVAIVTGAGGGIGEAYAKGLAAAGRARRGGGDQQGRRASASRVRSRPAAARRSRSRSTSPPPRARARWRSARSRQFGGIDFLVNNAAIFGGMKLAPYIDVDWDYYTPLHEREHERCAALCTRLRPAHEEARRRRDREPVLDRGLDGGRLLRPREARAERPHAGARARARAAEDPRERDRAGADRYRRAALGSAGCVHQADGRAASARASRHAGGPRADAVCSCSPTPRRG